MVVSARAASTSPAGSVNRARCSRESQPSPSGSVKTSGCLSAPRRPLGGVHVDVRSRWGVPGQHRVGVREHLTRPRRRLRAIPVAFATPPPFRHRFDAAAAQPVTTGPPLERCTGPLPAFGAGAGRLPRCRPGGSGGGLASALALATAYRPVYFAGLNRNPVFVVLAHDPTVAAVCQLLMSTTAAQLDHSRSIGLTASVGSLTSSGLLPWRAVSARWPLRRGPGRERGRGARP